MFEQRSELDGLAAGPLAMDGRPSFLDFSLDRVMLGPGSCNVAVRRAAFLAAGGFDPTISSGEDTDLFMRLSAHGSVSAIMAPVIVGQREAGADNLSTNRPALLAGIRRIYANHAAGRYPGAPQRLQAWLASLALNKYWLTLNSGDHSSAAGILRTGSAMILRCCGPVMLARCWWALLRARLPR